MKKTLAILVAFVMLFALLPATVFAADTKTITTADELAAAILAQADDETWILAPHTTFDLAPALVDTYGGIEINGSKDFIFPITADNLTIKGGTGTVITSSMAIDAVGGGAWHWQNFITVGGNNVTLDGMTLIPHINHYYDDSNGANKVIEVLGTNSTIKNLTVEPNPGGTTKDFSGSIYYSNNASDDILQNVFLSKGRISLTGKTDGSLTMSNVTIDFVGALLSDPDFVGFQPKAGVTYDIDNSTLLMNQARINRFKAMPNYPTELLLKAADNGTEVKANADVTYIVVIPASVDFGIIDKSMDPKSVAFPVSVEGALLEDGASITVTNTTVPTPMVMRDKNGTGNKTLAFTISKDIFTFTGNGTVGSNVRCRPAQLEAAGAYRGYMTFSVNYTTP